MKFIILLFVIMVGFAQTPIKPERAMPLTAREVAKQLESTCREGEELLKKAPMESSALDNLIYLVIVLQFDLSLAQENRTKKETKDLSGAKKCVRNLAQNTWIYWVRISKTSVSLR